VSAAWASADGEIASGVAASFMTLPTTRPGVWAGPRLSVVAIVFGLGILAGAELLLRWTRPSFLQGAPAGEPHVFSAVYGWALRPTYQGRWGNGKPFSVNGAAYRGRELVGPPPPGTTRIVMLGDSVAFGAGVTDGETFSQLLQEMQPGIEVANLGVSGYGTDQALLRLEHEGFALEPQVVVLHFCLANDFLDNMLDSYLYDGRTPKPYFVLEGGKLTPHSENLKRSWNERTGLWLRERSYLFNALSRLGQPALADAASLEGSAPEHWVSRKNKVLANFDEAAALTLELVRRMADVCRERGIRFLVLLHPDRTIFAGDRTLPGPFEAGRPELEGLRVVDLHRAYDSAGLSYDMVAIDKVGHLSPRGNEFVAEVIRGELSRMKARSAELSPVPRPRR